MNLYISTVSAVVFSVIFITTLVGMDVPFSGVYKYFHSYPETLKLAQYKNSARTTKALDYIYSLGGPVSESPQSLKDIHVLIVVVTVSRDRQPRSEKTGYLLQAVATMDKLMKTDTYFPKKFMFVCNVDKNPNSHSDAVQLQDYLPFIQKDGKNNLGLNNNVTTFIPELKNSGLVDKARKQEIVDYAYCLNASLIFNYRYALFLEDDVIPRKNLFEVLHHTLKYRLLEHRLDHDKLIVHKNFSFLKLYFPQRWQGYACETDRILELISIGTLGGILFTIVSYYFESESPRARKGKVSAAFVFLSGVLCFIGTAKILGRVNMMDVRRLTPYLFKFGPSAACCSQAMLYRREVLPNIIQHLLINNSLNKDLAIHDYSQKHSMPGYQLEPNLFMHTGMHTSLSSNVKSPEEFLF